MPTTTSDIAPEGAPAKRVGTRTKMLVSAAEVMRERGAAGVTIDAVLARSGAPRGSVYYHFPDGRNQILSEALRYSGDSITATIDAAADHGARALLREFIEMWERLLADGEAWLGAEPSLAELGAWMIEPRQAIETRCHGCAWLALFPSVAMVMFLSVVHHAGAPALTKQPPKVEFLSGTPSGLLLVSK